MVLSKNVFNFDSCFIIACHRFGILYYSITVITVIAASFRTIKRKGHI